MYNLKCTMFNEGKNSCGVFKNKNVKKFCKNFIINCQLYIVNCKLDKERDVKVKPFDNEFVLNVIDEYNNKIKCNKAGDYEIKLVDGLSGIVKGYLYEKEGSINKGILELHGPDHLWMRLTPLEIQGSYFAIERARGKVGIVGFRFRVCG